MKLKAVEVTFYDVANGNGWYEFDKKKLKDIKPLKATGYLVHKDSDWLVLAFTFNKDSEDWCGEFAIPMGCVLNLRILKTLEV